METIVGELTSRLIGGFLSPPSLILCALVALALASGLAGRVFLLLEQRSSRSRLRIGR